MSKKNAGEPKKRDRSKKPAASAAVAESASESTASVSAEETASAMQTVGEELLQRDAPPPAASEPTPGGPVTIRLYKRITEKGGQTSYAQPGVRASIYFSKNMFANGTYPEVIELTGINLALPSEKAIKAGVTSEERAAKAAAAATKAEERARKAQERAEKAVESARKMAERVAKLAPQAAPAQ